MEFGLAGVVQHQCHQVLLDGQQDPVESSVHSTFGAEALVSWTR